MSTDLVTNGKRHAASLNPMPIAARVYSIADIDVMAQNVSASGLFGMNRPQAFTLMCICMSEGLDPIQAVKRYHVIEGKPSMRSDAMLAEWQRQGGLVEWTRMDDQGCVAVFRHPRHAPRGFEVKFLQADAERAELLGKWNWRHYPLDMYRARVISRGIRILNPAIVVGIYTPEEMQDSSLGEKAASPDPKPWRATPKVAPTAEGGGAALAPAPAPVQGAGPAGPDPNKELKRFIRDQVEKARAMLRHAMREADALETGHEQVTNEHAVANHLLTQWIQDGLIQEEEVLGDSGRRDRARGAIAVLRLYREAKDDVEADVRDYIRQKTAEAFRSRGLEPPGGRDEDQATADDDPDEDGGEEEEEEDPA